ncbi:SDR family oxidoreductase [Spirosoma utsteinense]|uniref:NAD(P)H dehydrogenase (Quinone) n=1 Tax=Spirosoma utsteinense TaxID=2585773 RepID=A0ABR6W6Z6_9BACT|nr:SDR family oxidoreductase [Spirosoma utsteinense]MBC3787570.1 NAD(P)H dehydrogenase (quinone) [Spirosoma utsteinense]MBC3792257.1 NAD(P)H dehydrogenase (quinone) [Spirosoma utsteinense]
MILVTGATGHLGAATIHFLLKKMPASQVAALVRDADKAAALTERGVTIRVGHYDDTASLDRAMQGVEKVLLIAGTDEENRVQQHKNVVDAAKKAGVPFIAYTSRTLKDRSTMANLLMEGHFQTEDYIIASGLTYALFRNVLYMDVIPQFVGASVFETGIHLPAGEGKVPFALRDEMGEAMANVLAADSSGSAIYNFTGSEGYSFADVAAVLTDLSGKRVKYTPAEPSVFETQLAGRGVPDVIVQRVIRFLTDIKNGQEDDVYPDLENLLGRKPASLREGLKGLYNLG